MSQQYVFSLYQTVKLGQPCDLKMSSRPSIGLHATLVLASDSHGISTVSSWKMGGEDLIDQFAVRPVTGAMFSPGVCRALRLPTLRKGDEVTLRGRYGGAIPKGCKSGESYTIVFTVQGRAT